MRTLLRFQSASIALALLLHVTTLGASELEAQTPDLRAAAQDALQMVASLVGEWQGEGWSLRPDGTRERATVHEVVQWKLDRTALLIEGRGTNEAGDVAHDAMAVLYYEPGQQAYAMHSHLANGMNVRPYFEVLEPNTRFEWGFEAPAGKIRYAVTLSDDRTAWSEVGEFSPDGESWTRILEMQLKKQ